jgi:hypothetical protein
MRHELDGTSPRFGIEGEGVQVARAVLSTMGWRPWQTVMGDALQQAIE